MSLSYSDNDDVVLKDPDGVPTGTLTNPMHVVTTVAVVTQPSNYALFSIGEELNMASSGANNPLVLLRNPSGSGKLLLIWQISVGVTVTNQSAFFRVTVNPTVTGNGTTVTPRQRRAGVSAVSPVALSTTLPTFSAAGDSLQVHAAGQNMSSTLILPEFSMSVYPNNALAILGKPSSNNRNAAVSLIWAEVTL